MASLLEEFHMLVLEEEGPDGMLFQQHGLPSHLLKKVMVCL
jgi:hypothetical protein